jgi:hypothetical protein
VTFTPTDTADYTDVSGSAQLVVDQATPTLSWPSPAAITYGTALGGTQLDATASAVVNGSSISVPGAFTYSPAAGAVLGAGTHTLSVTFTPTDTADYTDVSGSAQLVVDQATLTATGVPFAAGLGAPFSGILATFANADPLGSPASYSAIITWGDGATSAGVISDEGGDVFAVSGSHTYLSAGTDNVTIHIEHKLGNTTSAAAHDTATVTSGVVIAGAAGDTLELMRTAGGGPGDVTYILDGGAPVSLHGATSFTFNAGAGNATMIVNLANGGPIASGGAVSFSGGAGVDTLDLLAAGFAVGVNSAGFNVGGQLVTFTGVATTQINDAGAVNTIAGPSTANRAAAFAGLTPQERFVQALYLDELGRRGARAELDAWVNALNSPGMSQATIAAGIEHSPEARDHLVRSWYWAYLGRQAANGEELGWVNLLLQGQSEEQVLSQILASPEFYARAQTLSGSGTADARYVQALYQVLLNRTGAPADVGTWVSVLQAVGRQEVALGFLTSREFRADQVVGYYNALLHRPDDSQELSFWVSTGLNIEDVRMGFEASDEFFAEG